MSMIGSMFGFNLKDRKVRSVENYWDWNQSDCRLGGADYSGLDMLNIKMMQTWSSDVCRWRLIELD